jgi:hypothetical protein
MLEPHGAGGGGSGCLMGMAFANFESMLRFRSGILARSGDLSTAPISRFAGHSAPLTNDIF